MYKIELRTIEGKLLKSKTYQSDKIYNQWFMKHTVRYGKFYQVIGYKWVDEKWEILPTK